MKYALKSFSPSNIMKEYEVKVKNIPTTLLQVAIIIKFTVWFPEYVVEQTF